MFERTDVTTRRNVLGTIGGALGVAALSGMATADATTDDVNSGDCITADGPDGVAVVYDECGTADPVSRVENGKQGTVREVCPGIDGGLAHVVWDDAAPDGWVPEDHLSACISPH